MPFPGTQQVPIVFSGGLNSKISEFSLDQPNLQQAINAIYNKVGQVDKRTGMSNLSNSILNGGTITGGVALAIFNEELLLLDGTKVFSYDSGNDQWIDRGLAFSTINDQIRVINTKIATQNNPDCTTFDNLQLYVWEDDRPVPVSTGAGIRYSLFDVNTGAAIVGDKFVYPLGFAPKCVADNTNNRFDIFYEASYDQLFLQTIPFNNPQVITPGLQVIGDGYNIGAGFAYDVATIETGPVNVALFYSSTTGIKAGNIPGIGFITYAAGRYATVLTSTASSPSAIWMAWTDINGGLFVQNIITTTITQIDIVSPVNITIIEDTTLGNLNITYEVNPDNGQPNYIVNAILDSNNNVSITGKQLKVGLASKAFKTNGQVFVNVVDNKNLQATYYTLCVSQGFTAVAAHSPSNGGGYRTNGLLSQCDLMSANNFVFAGQRKGPFTSYQNSQTVNLGVAGYTIDFVSANAFNNVASNNNLHIVGGVKKIYDGISVVEDNFHYFPELPDGYACDVTLVPGGNLTYNPLTQPNSYQYVVIYEWTDNKEQVQRGGVGVAKTVITTAVGQGALITVPTITITDKDNPRSPISIAIYRTQDSLPIFYKITNDDNPLVNDTTVNTLTFFDPFSDLQIAANENLYTGSQLANTVPPACSVIALYQNRLFINSTEDKNVLWYSQNKFEQDQYNTLPLDWNTSFVEGIESQDVFGNDITAIGRLDNSLAIFKKTSIFLLQGDGPNAFNTSGQFNDAQLLVSDTGCNNSNSLVFITQTPKLPGGLLFKSDKGIYLLGRDTSLNYIGAPVEQYNHLTITSANLLSDSNQVVFTTLEGTCLVYNYFFDAWTVWENLPAVDAIVWQNKLAILAPNGTVVVQDTTGTIYTDTFSNSTSYPVEMGITTPWIKFGGAANQQGYQAVYNCMLLATLQGPHIFQVQVAYDYNPTIIDTVLINSSVIANRWGGLPIWGSQGTWGDYQFSNFQFQINLSRPRCQSVQLTFTDLDDENSQGYSLNALVFEVMPLPGPMRVPASNMVGSGTNG